MEWIAGVLLIVILPAVIIGVILHFIIKSAVISALREYNNDKK